MNSSDFQNASTAFSKQAPVFDSIEEQNAILHWMRLQVHTYCRQYFRPGDNILELNCGTGRDAVFFAAQGMIVHATDIAEGMIAQLEQKITAGKIENITTQICSYSELDKIERRDFDHIFSDFGGLNCTAQIEQVVAQFKSRLKPGGTATLVIMPPVCPWEILLALKGNFKTATRRFKNGGLDSQVEGVHFNTYYFTSSRVIKAFGNDFRKLQLRGLAALVPPPYLEKFPKKFPKLFKVLTKWDEKLTRYFPFNRYADHFILTMQLK
jgi:ubiquinone/menaquinone biosynthesis C-methylase UbiE